MSAPINIYNTDKLHSFSEMNAKLQSIGVAGTIILVKKGYHSLVQQLISHNTKQQPFDGDEILNSTSNQKELCFSSLLMTNHSIIFSYKRLSETKQIQFIMTNKKLNKFSKILLKDKRVFNASSYRTSEIAYAQELQGLHVVNTEVIPVDEDFLKRAINNTTFYDKLERNKQYNVWIYGKGFQQKMFVKFDRANKLYVFSNGVKIKEEQLHFRVKPIHSQQMRRNINRDTINLIIKYENKLSQMQCQPSETFDNILHLMSNRLHSENCKITFRRNVINDTNTSIDSYNIISNDVIVIHNKADKKQKSNNISTSNNNTLNVTTNNSVKKRSRATTEHITNDNNINIYEAGCMEKIREQRKCLIDGIRWQCSINGQCRKPEETEENDEALMYGDYATGNIGAIVDKFDLDETSKKADTKLIVDTLTRYGIDVILTINDGSCLPQSISGATCNGDTQYSSQFTQTGYNYYKEHKIELESIFGENFKKHGMNPKEWQSEEFCYIWGKILNLTIICINVTSFNNKRVMIRVRPRDEFSIENNDQMKDVIVVFWVGGSHYFTCGHGDNVKLFNLLSNIPTLNELKQKPNITNSNNTNASDEWSCDICTYLNESTTDSCEMCGLKREKKPKIINKSEAFGGEIIWDINIDTEWESRFEPKSLQKIQSILYKVDTEIDECIKNNEYTDIGKLSTMKSYWSGLS